MAVRNKDAIHLTKDPELVVKHHLETNPEGVSETELLRAYVDRATNYESNQRLDPESLEQLYMPFSVALDKLVYSDTAVSWVGETEGGEKERHYQLQRFTETGAGTVETSADRERIGEDIPAGLDPHGDRAPSGGYTESGVLEHQELLFEDAASQDTAWEDYPWDDQGDIQEIPWNDWNLPPLDD